MYVASILYYLEKERPRFEDELAEHPRLTHSADDRKKLEEAWSVLRGKH